MESKAGWYDDPTDPARLRYWDGSSWTNNYAPGGPTAAPSGVRIPKEQIAHDLAMVYLSNRYGVRVTGDFSVSASIGSFEALTQNDWTNTVRIVDDVTGTGSVETENLPSLEDAVFRSVGTGEKFFFGLGPEKTRQVPTGELQVDEVFRNLIRDYQVAYGRILQILHSM